MRCASAENTRTAQRRSRKRSCGAIRGANSPWFCRRSGRTCRTCRDSNAVGKTVSGLLKLLYPDASQDVPEDDFEWAVRLALECRRRVKEQQKRIGTAEFRNTQFSYSMGLDGAAPRRRSNRLSHPTLPSGPQISGISSSRSFLRRYR
jgi:hypothetical protein